MEATDRWRALILYGRNVATYKIALGKVLLDLAAAHHTAVDMPQLAEAFLDAYADRLATPRPQLNVSGRLTLMERIIAGIRSESITRTQAIEIVAREGFNDVVPRFHTLPRGELEGPFYHVETYRLTLSDALIEIASSPEATELRSELDSRWSLLELAFRPDYAPSDLWTNGSELYYGRSFNRRAVTYARPVIEGYQNGFCFYCGEPLGGGSVHVDHLIPRSYLSHDEIWNLVLAHQNCNLSKSDNLPPKPFLENLFLRNEYYIASNHPIKAHLMAATGKTEATRRAFLNATYEAALRSIPRLWRPARIARFPDPLQSLRLIEAQSENRIR